MNVNDIRKQAEEFAKKMGKQLDVGVYDNQTDLEIAKSYNEGYINGLEEGYFQAKTECRQVYWHDLNVDKNDLPKKYGWYIVLYYNDGVLYSKNALFDVDDCCWLNHSIQVDENLNMNIRAWMEIPETPEFLGC